MVNRSRNYTLFFYLIAGLVASSLVLVNYLSMEFRARVDLTADQRYTLSEGTRRIFERLVDPVEVTYYVSAELPALRVNLERDVVDKLSELADASQGKLKYRVERIESDQFDSKAAELEKLEIFPVTDLQLEGAGTAANMFSSIHITHGTAPKVAINGIFNLVNKEDEYRTSRVDTLEFDIMFALLRMKSQVTKPPLKQLLRSLNEPMKVMVLTSEQMPKHNPKLGATLLEATARLEGQSAGKVEVRSQIVPWGQMLNLMDDFGRPAYFSRTSEPTVDPNPPKEQPQDPPKDPPQDPPKDPPKEDPPKEERPKDQPKDAPKGNGGPGGADPASPTPGAPAADPPGPGPAAPPSRDPPAPGPAAPPPRDPPREVPAPAPAREGPNFYYAVVGVFYSDNVIWIHDFSTETTADACLAKIEERLWELVKPRTTLGLITPAPAMDFNPHGQPPQSPYAALAGYIQRNLGYEARLIDLRARQRIPSDLALLIVFEPQSLSERELYEIDRYLTEGGNVALLFQGWGANMRLMRPDSQEVSLSKRESSKAFTDWVGNLGLSFGQNFLVHESGFNMHAFYFMRRQPMPAPIDLPLAVSIGPDDIDRASVYARGMASMPLPFVSEVKLDDSRVGDLKLERRDIAKLSGAVYKFLPEDERFAMLSRSLGFDDRKAVLDDPAAKPGPDVRLHKLGHAPVVASLLTGSFPSFWEGKVVPKWPGAPDNDPDIGGQPAPPVKARRGNLVVCGSAASLSEEYFQSWREKDTRSVVGSTVSFYRNLAEANIYGDELVSLRAKTGAPPRITGSVQPGDKALWFLLCIGGVPLLLAGFGFARGAWRAKQREEYAASLESGDKV